MTCCRICGDEKEKEKFSYIPYFRKFKKNKVTWCHKCQQMYMEMIKQKELIDRFVEDKNKFTVSFD